MKNKYSHRLLFKWTTKIFIITIIYTILFLILFGLCNILCHFITWQPTDKLYQILTAIAYTPILTFIVWLVGFSIIIIISLFRVLSYIDTIVYASQYLVTEDVNWISLPEDLHDVELRMNQVKQASIDHRKQAEMAERRKNDLIVYLAHDIKTPLTSMIGYLSLLNENEDLTLAKRRKYIKIALDKSYHLEELINELFDITKYNQGAIILHKQTLNLNLMIEQIIDDFYPMLQEQHKQITFNSKSPIHIIADSNQLARVLDNLIKNAITYSNKDASINIKVKEDNGKVIIIVQNPALMMSEQELNQLFDKFYRLDKSRTSKTGGSGLGLAIARDIITLHGGTIKATSNNNILTFTVILPIS